MNWTKKEIKTINELLGLLHKHKIEYIDDLERIILEHKEFTKAYSAIKETRIIPKIQEEEVDETAI